jgi:hypothetical protein
VTSPDSSPDMTFVANYAHRPAAMASGTVLQHLGRALQVGNRHTT